MIDNRTLVGDIIVISSLINVRVKMYRRSSVKDIHFVTDRGWLNGVFAVYYRVLMTRGDSMRIWKRMNGFGFEPERILWGSQRPSSLCCRRNYCFGL